MTNNEILKDLSHLMKEDRYMHTLGVMYTAANLSYRWNYDQDKAILAAILHDCAKTKENKDFYKLCHDANIPIQGEESEHLNQVLHADYGAYLAKEKYGITDEEIIHAIKVHCLGSLDMNLLDKIIYIADYIEPGRQMHKGLDELRKLAYIDLDAAVGMAASQIAEYVTANGFTLDKTTLDVAKKYSKL